MKFTFKTEHPTGRYSSFSPSRHYIKLRKKICGSIVDKDWSIRLMVIKKDINEDGNPNCKWRWAKLSKESNSLQEAKDWLNANIGSIMSKYQIHTQGN